METLQDEIVVAILNYLQCCGLPFLHDWYLCIWESAHKFECIINLPLSLWGGGGGCLNGNLSLLVLGAAGIRLTKTTSKMALPTPILRPEELNIRTSHH